MRRLQGWLTTEMFRVRGLKIRRLHGVALVLVLTVAAILIFALGVFVAYEYPYRTTSRPRVPAGQTLPSQSTCPHVMGGCLPAPKTVNSAAITATAQGCDFSNNNPVYSLTEWKAIAEHNSFCIFKVSEGTQLDDPTARPMEQLARSVGLVVGGYDFLHPCLVSATAEGQRFGDDLEADGITGKGSLPGVGDAEYGGTGCNVRQWLTTWAAAVYAVVKRHPWIYTGAWWWDPHVGAWWLPNALAWISGYVPWPPPLPAGRVQVDLWQFTSTGSNGATIGDLSLWRDGAAAFNVAAGDAPAPKPKPVTTTTTRTVTTAGKPRPGELVFKASVTASKRRVVWATATCKLGRCDATTVLRAQIGLGRHDPVVARWKHNLADGRSSKHRFVLSKTVFADLRKHRVKIKANGNPHTFWIAKR